MVFGTASFDFAEDEHPLPFRPEPRNSFFNTQLEVRAGSEEGLHPLVGLLHFVEGLVGSLLGGAPSFVAGALEAFELLLGDLALFGQLLDRLIEFVAGGPAGLLGLLLQLDDAVVHLLQLGFDLLDVALALFWSCGLFGFRSGLGLLRGFLLCRGRWFRRRRLLASAAE